MRVRCATAAAPAAACSTVARAVTRGRRRRGERRRRGRGRDRAAPRLVTVGDYFSCGCATTGPRPAGDSTATGRRRLRPTSSRRSAPVRGSRAACSATAPIVCWGADAQKQSTPPVGSGFTQISAGDTHACALTSSGAMTCWGTSPASGGSRCPGRTSRSRPAPTSAAPSVRNYALLCWGRLGHTADALPNPGTVLHARSARGAGCFAFSIATVTRCASTSTANLPPTRPPITSRRSAPAATSRAACATTAGSFAGARFPGSRSRPATRRRRAGSRRSASAPRIRARRRARRDRLLGRRSDRGPLAAGGNVQRRQRQRRRRHRAGRGDPRLRSTHRRHADLLGVRGEPRGVAPSRRLQAGERRVDQLVRDPGVGFAGSSAGAIESRARVTRPTARPIAWRSVLASLAPRSRPAANGAGGSTGLWLRRRHPTRSPGSAPVTTMLATSSGARSSASDARALLPATGAPPAGSFQQVETGMGHSCAISSSDGAIVCWGGNTWGESTPPAGGGYRRLAVGDSAGGGGAHSCAIAVRRPRHLLGRSFVRQVRAARPALRAHRRRRELHLRRVGDRSGLVLGPAGATTTGLSGAKVLSFAAS